MARDIRFSTLQEVPLLWKDFPLRITGLSPMYKRIKLSMLVGVPTQPQLADDSYLKGEKMKHARMIFSTLLIAALMLTACVESEQTSTNVPVTDLPDMTATVETPLVTETVTSGDTTATPAIPATGEDGPARLSNQLDYTVWNQNGEQIGEVNDMVIDLDTAAISYVIVGTGGFLEIGEKDVLVPWDALELQTGSDATGGEPNAFVLLIDQAQFEAAPDVDIGSLLPPLGEPAADWDVDIRSFWETGAVPASTTASETETPAAPVMTETTQPAATEDTSQGPGAAADLQGVILASELLGLSVGLSPGQGQGQGEAQGQSQATATPGTVQVTSTPDLGQGSGQGVGNFSGLIEDAIVDIETGEILYLVIYTTLGDGERWVPVPLGFFQWDVDNRTLLLNVTPAMISDAPFFTDGAFPDTTVDGWDSDFDSFWQNTGP